MNTHGLEGQCQHSYTHKIVTFDMAGRHREVSHTEGSRWQTHTGFDDDDLTVPATPATWWM